MVNRAIRKEKQNKGFTLVEVLIAITILAIIVVPFLQAFVTGARTNAKAKQIMKTTTIAQNVMEQIKAYSLEDIARQFNGYPLRNNSAIENDVTILNGAASFCEAVDSASGLVPVVKSADAASASLVNSSIRDAADTTAKPEGIFVGQNKSPYADQYHFMLNGITMESSQYDVLIDMSLNAANGKHNMTEINAMNRRDCAYYVQMDSDDNAAKEYVIRNHNYAGTSYADSFFKQLMRREIVIDINDDGAGNQNVKVTYNYTLDGSYTSEADEKYTEYSTAFDNYGSGETLKAVYLYYLPLYGTNRDSIKVVNESDLDIDVYLIKMQGPDYDETLETTYLPHVSLKEYKSNNGLSNAKICTNIDTFTETYSADIAVGGVIGEIDDDDIGNVQAKECLYDVTIRVYKHDDTNPFQEDNLYTTFTGSKLDNSNKAGN